MQTFLDKELFNLKISPHLIYKKLYICTLFQFLKLL